MQVLAFQFDIGVISEVVGNEFYPHSMKRMINLSIRVCNLTTVGTIRVHIFPDASAIWEQLLTNLEAA